MVDPLAVVAALWGLAVWSGLWWAIRQTARRRVRSRMRILGLEPRVTPTEEKSWSPREAAGRLGAAVQARWPRLGSGLADSIDSAGLTGRTTPAEVLGWKIVAVAVGPLAGLFAVLAVGAPSVLPLFALAFLGWIGLDAWLAQRRAARRRAIIRELPTTMDLLTLSLEAGMGLERALRLICQRLEGPLADELRRVLADVDLGMGRREAFERMAGRVAVDEIYSLVGAVVQAEALGTGLVGAMRGQTRQVRLGRRRAAEAEALRAPIKMLFPMVLFILPALLIVLLGPIVLQIHVGLPVR